MGIWQDLKEGFRMKREIKRVLKNFELNAITYKEATTQANEIVADADISEGARDNAYADVYVELMKRRMIYWQVYW